MTSANGQNFQSKKTKNRRSRLTALSLICSCGRRRTHATVRKEQGTQTPVVWPTSLDGLWDWVGMAPCMGPMSSVHAHSLWAGLCPEKLVKTKTTPPQVQVTFTLKVTQDFLVKNSLFYFENLSHRVSLSKDKCTCGYIMYISFQLF